MDGAGNVTTLYFFPSGTSTTAGLVQATDGWFYGTTQSPYTIFKISSAGDFASVHTMSAAVEGVATNAPLFQDASDGAFYGMTLAGGSHDAGTLFRMGSTGTITVLHNFAGPLAGDSWDPRAGLIKATDGYLYGAASDGGVFRSGTLFRVSPARAYEIVRFFGTDPLRPLGGLIQANGFLYGTTAGGAPGGRERRRAGR